MTQNLLKYYLIFPRVEACVAKRLTPWTLDLDPGFKPQLYSTLSLFTLVYKWVPATNCWGVTLRWTSIPEIGISSGRLGFWFVCAFTYLSYLSPWGKNLNQYYCLAYDNEIPPIPQNSKKSGISFSKVSGNQERKNNEKDSQVAL